MESTTVLQEVADAVEQEIVPVPYEDSPSSVGSIWKLENCDAPKSEFCVYNLAFTFLLLPVSGKSIFV